MPRRAGRRPARVRRWRASRAPIRLDTRRARTAVQMPPWLGAAMWPPGARGGPSVPRERQAVGRFGMPGRRPRDAHQATYSSISPSPRCFSEQRCHQPCWTPKWQYAVASETARKVPTYLAAVVAADAAGAATPKSAPARATVARIRFTMLVPLWSFGVFGGALGAPRNTHVKDSPIWLMSPWVCHERAQCVCTLAGLPQGGLIRGGRIAQTACCRNPYVK